MEQDNIEEYFNTVLENNKDTSVEAIGILKKLIDYTMTYRDELKEETGEILTVGVTKMAIDVYLEAVQTEHLRGDLDPKIDRLVKFWLTKINGVSF